MVSVAVATDTEVRTVLQVFHSVSLGLLVFHSVSLGIQVFHSVSLGILGFQSIPHSFIAFNGSSPGLQGILSAINPHSNLRVFGFMYGNNYWSDFDINELALGFSSGHGFQIKCPFTYSRLPYTRLHTRFLIS